MSTWYTEKPTVPGLYWAQMPKDYEAWRGPLEQPKMVLVELQRALSPNEHILLITVHAHVLSTINPERFMPPQVSSRLKFLTGSKALQDLSDFRAIRWSGPVEIPTLP